MTYILFWLLYWSVWQLCKWHYITMVSALRLELIANYQLINDYTAVINRLEFFSQQQSYY